MHSKSQGIMKTTIPTQPAMTKRLNRPTSSPPALVMPRPRYAEPPTRAVLKSFEHEKTLLDMDPTQLQQPLLTGQGGLESGNNDDEHGKRKVYGNNIGNPSAASLTIRFPIPSATVSTPSRSQKLSPTIDTDLLPQHDTKPVIRNKKSLDSGIAAVINTKKHESMNSITGSDDSNRVYESALESPMMTSTSTTLDHFHQSHTTSESAFGPTQSQRHSSPSVLSGTLVPQLLPPTASDSSETVTPAGSTNQQLRTVPPEQPNIISAINNMNLIRSVPEYTNLEHILTPNTTTRQHPPVSSPKSKHQKPNGALLQQLHPSQDLESLQQQVLLIQQQREMDRVEYERMEQVHKERTQWMKAEIDRTQSKLLELAASKRATMSSQQYVDDLPPSHANDAENGYCNDAGNPTASTFQKQQYEQHHSSTNSTPFRSQKSTKSSVNLGRLSRSSSKASNGGGSSSSGGQSNRLKGEAQLKHDKLGRDAVAQQWDSSTADFMTAMDGNHSTLSRIDLSTIRKIFHHRLHLRHHGHDLENNVHDPNRQNLGHP
ncbi:hypothetical protein BCR42DRAFT_89352 [Absidia repens]|uniref:Uncharacterized protein n=1 Tax=Absidia repens TaxID=90262 RepID=A0A1X2IYG8_9FUNG|nr:hypothetical protein BCR42DRAFT_89352 [Absidia repens]